tara:strand:- start:1048 stop:1788 length:741 start_codon:yes stop_codon:yes gene_type:complete
MKAFISHSHEDAKLADSIKQKLLKRGIQVIEINDNISIGDNLVTFIESSIKQADIYIILLTKSYEDSKWADLEQILIFDEKFRSKQGKGIFPILIDKNVKIPSLLRNIAYADLTNKDNREIKLDDVILRISNAESTEKQLSEKNINYQQMKNILREQEELLKIKELNYKLYQNKQDKLRNSFKYSFLLVSIISVLISLIFFITKFDKSTFDSEFLNIQSLIFYLLGFLTAIIPSIYLIIKRKRNGQ